MVNVAYEYDATKSLFVHKMTEESLFSEVNYILSVSEFLEILEYKKPSLILIHTSLEEMLALAKLSSWLKEHVLPQIARIGVRKMAIISKKYPELIASPNSYYHFPWLTIGTFNSELKAKKWLLNTNC
jgi:hypothetical protein